MNRIFFFLHCKDTATFLSIQTFAQKSLESCAILCIFLYKYVAQHKNVAFCAENEPKSPPKGEVPAKTQTRPTASIRTSRFGKNVMESHWTRPPHIGINPQRAMESERGALCGFDHGTKFRNHLHTHPDGIFHVKMEINGHDGTI